MELQNQPSTSGEGTAFNQGIPLGQLMGALTTLTTPEFIATYGPAFFLMHKSAKQGFPKRQPTAEIRLKPKDLQTTNVKMLAFPLRPAPGGTALTVGRTLHNDVCIGDISISRVHAAVKVRPDGYFLHDTGSRNGTSLGGVRLERDAPQQLFSGAQVQFGAIVCDFVLAEDLPKIS